MAISTTKGSRNLEAVTPLLGSDDQEELDDYVDYKGYPSRRSKSGGWRSASFILAAGSLERFAFRGIECNLINYLTGQLGESMATAAGNVNLWTGLGSLMPVFGALVADSFLGIYQTNFITSILYILGLGFSTISVALISISNSKKTTVASSELQVLFFVSLYVVALAQGYQSSIQVFGADQFDRQHPEESKANSSFFNWWHFGLSSGVVIAHFLPYIQDNVGWEIGFGIPCLAMLVGHILLLLGNRTYRFPIRRFDDEESPSGSTFVSSQEEYQGALQIDPQKSTQNHKVLINKVQCATTNTSKDNSMSCCIISAKIESKKTLKLLPIWCTCLMYTISWAQALTLFTKQATTVDRSIGQVFNVPSASLRVFIPLTTMCFTTIYDRVFVPIARVVTGNPFGITEFQRIKIGMTISIMNMSIAALVEKRRLEIAQEYGLIDIQNATIPMSFWWLVPQYVLCSVAYVFTQVGMQKFFYDQVPTELRSIGLSLSFGAFGIGNFLGSFLIYVIDEATSQNGRDSWLSTNLNRAHLDYFYWLLSGLGFLGLVAFAFFTKSYVCDEKALESNVQA